MFMRIAVAVPLGSGVTLALLLLMHTMIDSGHGFTEARSGPVVEFVRVERTETVQTREARPEKPRAAEPAPAMPQPSATADFSGEIRVALAGPQALGFGNSELSGVGFGVTDGEYIPIVKVAPRYPVRAAQRRLEGYVIVEFVVTASGAVRDVVVVESSSELFEDAAIEAALKFKYKPRVIDGQSIEVSGVQNRITFKLDA